MKIHCLILIKRALCELPEMLKLVVDVLILSLPHFIVQVAPSKHIIQLKLKPPFTLKPIRFAQPLLLIDLTLLLN